MLNMIPLSFLNASSSNLLDQDWSEPLEILNGSTVLDYYIANTNGIEDLLEKKRTFKINHLTIIENFI